MEILSKEFRVSSDLSSLSSTAICGPNFNRESEYQRATTGRKKTPSVFRNFFNGSIGLVMLAGTACAKNPLPEYPQSAPTCEAADIAPSWHHKPLLASLRADSTEDSMKGEKVFENPWKVTASSEVFYGLGEKMCENPESKALLCNKRAIKFLYPASRVLLSPLDMAFAMAEKAPAVQEMEFTYTEIDQESYEKIDKVAAAMVKKLPNLSHFKVEEQIFEQGQGDRNPKYKRITFNVQTSDGRCLLFTINFEYRMSKSGANGYSEYFRPESAYEADIWISHDMSGDGPNSPYMAIYNYLQTIDGTRLHKPHILVMEYEDHYRLKSYNQSEGEKIYSVHKPGERAYYDNLGQSLFIQPGEYGCGANHRSPGHGNVPSQFFGAVAIELDQELLGVIYGTGGKKAMESFSSITGVMEYTDFLTTKNLDFNLYLKNLKTLAEIAKKTKNERIKRKINKAITGYLLDFFNLELIKKPNIAASVYQELQGGNEYLQPVKDFEGDLKNLLRQGNSPFKTHIRALLTAYHLGKMHNDQKLLQQVKGIVGIYLMAMQSDTLKTLLDDLTINDPKNIFLFKVDEKGFFVSDNPNPITTFAETLQHEKGNVVVETLLTIIYLGKALDNPEVTAVCSGQNISDQEDAAGVIDSLRRRWEMIRGEYDPSYTNTALYITHKQAINKVCQDGTTK